MLLIDEPELHLHPALQRSLFSSLETVAERAQVWIVTHSPRLVTSAPLPSVLHMKAPEVAEQNQLSRAADEKQRTELLISLGIHPIDVLQSELLVIVEGATDEQQLAACLPIQFGRTTVLQAGHAAGVEATSRALSTVPELESWLAIRDRDLLSDDEVRELQREFTHLFIWPGRCLESEFLYVPLISKTCTRAARQISQKDVRDALQRWAEEDRQEILAGLIEAELVRRHRHRLRDATEPLDKLRAYLEATSVTTVAKLDEFDTVTTLVQKQLDARWSTDWPKLMDGKRVLGKAIGLTPFKTKTDFHAALVLCIHEEEDVVPPGIKALRDRMKELLQGQHPHPQSVGVPSPSAP